MISLTEARKKSHEVSKRCWEKCLNYFSQKEIKALYNIPMIVYFDTKGDYAGYCHYEENPKNDWIEINTRYFETNNIEFIKEIVRHELAHAIVHRVYGVTGHNKIFHNILTYLGGEASRFISSKINDPVPRIGSNRKKYVCNKCGRIYYLSKRMINEIVNNQSIRLCANCNNPLHNFVKE